MKELRTAVPRAGPASGGYRACPTPGLDGVRTLSTGLADDLGVEWPCPASNGDGRQDFLVGAAILSQGLGATTGSRMTTVRSWRSILASGRKVIVSQESGFTQSVMSTSVT